MAEDDQFNYLKRTRNQPNIRPGSIATKIGTFAKTFANEMYQGARKTLGGDIPALVRQTGEALKNYERTGSFSGTRNQRVAGGLGTGQAAQGAASLTNPDTMRVGGRSKYQYTKLDPGVAYKQRADLMQSGVRSDDSTFTAGGGSNLDEGEAAYGAIPKSRVGAVNIRSRLHPEGIKSKVGSDTYPNAVEAAANRTMYDSPAEVIDSRAPPPGLDGMPEGMFDAQGNPTKIGLDYMMKQAQQQYPNESAVGMTVGRGSQALQDVVTAGGGTGVPVRQDTYGNNLDLTRRAEAVASGTYQAPNYNGTDIQNRLAAVTSGTYQAPNVSGSGPIFGRPGAQKLMDQYNQRIADRNARWRANLGRSEIEADKKARVAQVNEALKAGTIAPRFAFDIINDIMEGRDNTINQKAATEEDMRSNRATEAYNQQKLGQEGNLKAAEIQANLANMLEDNARQQSTAENTAAYRQATLASRDQQNTVRNELAQNRLFLQELLGKARLEQGQEKIGQADQRFALAMYNAGLDPNNPEHVKLFTGQ